MLELTEIGGDMGTGLSVSPNGRYLAFEAHKADVETNSYQVAWFVVDTSDGHLVNVGAGGAATLFRNTLDDGRVVGSWISRYARWSPDSRGIAYLKKADGERQIWWSDPDGEGQERLTDSAADVQDFYWNEVGSELYFTTGPDREVLDRRTSSRFRDGHVFDHHKDWSTIDGHPFYPPYDLTDGKPRIMVFDMISKTERAADSNEASVFAELKGAEDSRSQRPEARVTALTEIHDGVAWLQPDDPLKQGVAPPMTLYASVEGHDGTAVRCIAPECTGIFDTSTVLRSGIHWGRPEDEIFFVRKEGGGYSRRSWYAWRIGKPGVRKVFSTDEWISDCSVVDHHAYCFRESPKAPRTIISLDLGTGKVETLVDPNPEFGCVSPGAVELLEWEYAEGLETFGYLVKPPNYDAQRRYPLVLVGYRARFALRGGVGNEYPVHLLARHGFMVVVYEKPEIHEAREIYSDPLDIARARWGPNLFDVRMPLEAFRALIDILARRGLVDPGRVAITGLSAGVGDVNYSLIHSNLFAAAIASSSDFGPGSRPLIGVSSEAFRQYRKAIGAARYPGPHGSLFAALSLSVNEARIDTPLLINAAASEHVWALEEVLALIEGNKPVEMVVYPDEGHIKWHPAHRASIYERNVDWLKFWLQDVEDPDPAKQGQYSRWRSLREKRDLAERGLPGVATESAGRGAQSRQ